VSRRTGRLCDFDFMPWDLAQLLFNDEARRKQQAGRAILLQRLPTRCIFHFGSPFNIYSLSSCAKMRINKTPSVRFPSPIRIARVRKREIGNSTGCLNREPVSGSINNSDKFARRICRHHFSIAFPLSGTPNLLAVSNVSARRHDRAMILHCDVTPIIPASRSPAELARFLIRHRSIDDVDVKKQ